MPALSRRAGRARPLGSVAWSLAKRIAPWALAVVVLALIAHEATRVDWPQVGHAMAQVPPRALAIAAVLALISHALFSSYDLVARHQTGHRLSTPRTLGIAAVCYAFNLNFGSLVGALAMKLRLYARAGLRAHEVARIIVVAILTNWLGYLALGGAVLAVAPPPLPPQITLTESTLRAIGAAMVGMAVAYLLLCAWRHGREFGWRGHRFAWPSLRVALWQLAVSMLNWALMGVVVWVLLRQAAPYTTVLAVLLLAAIAGVATHVPAGLGVIEAVFVACLGSALPPAHVLAALLSYRALYYLVPLALASIAYAAAEATRRRTASLRGA
jgi:glycosyltransferase 2 family protein